jgi:hypothetical protein
MWKANGKTTTLQLFLDSLEEAVDLSRDRQILEHVMIEKSHGGTSSSEPTDWLDSLYGMRGLPFHLGRQIVTIFHGM